MSGPLLAVHVFQLGIAITCCFVPDEDYEVAAGDGGVEECLEMCKDGPGEAGKKEFGAQAVDAGLCDRDIVVESAKFTGFVVRFQNVGSKGKCAF